jgi:TonB family protein
MPQQFRPHCKVRFAQQTIPNGVGTPPEVVIHPNPAYRDEARRRGIEGKVMIQAHFDADDTITVLNVVKGLGDGLDENALAAIQEWRFSRLTEPRREPPAAPSF